MSKSHSLNLWNVEDSSSKLDIDVSSAKVDVTCTGSQHIKIGPALMLVDAVGGDIPSVSTKIHSIDAAIAAGNSGSAAASALVAQNLASYQTSNDSTVATISATVTTNKAIADASATSDAAARVQLQSDVTALITSEETDRIAADDVLTASLATEVSNRTTSVSDEAIARSSADSSLTAALAVETGRIDGILAGSDVNLDSFLEVVTAYSGLNTSALAQIASLNTALVALTARVDALTTP